MAQNWEAMDFPAQDPCWSRTLEAARKSIGESERVVAHDLYLAFFPGALPYRYVTAGSLKNIDWLILHKDNGREFGLQVLNRLKGAFQPVFANEVFVILVNKKLRTILCRSNNPAGRSRVAPLECAPVHVNALFGESKTGKVNRRWRIPLTWFFTVVVFYFARPSPLLLATGAVVALAGLFIRAWATGHISKNAELAVTGPYAHTRHPLYLGNFLIGAGLVVASGNFLAGGVCMVIVAYLYARFMREEERILGELFGIDHWFYSVAVPKFLPRLLPVQTGRSGKAAFDPAAYFRSGEYRALAGVLIFLGLLALRSRMKF